MTDEVVRNDPSGGARCVLAVRRMIKTNVAEDIIHNPAIDMLLALFLAHGDRDRLTADEVCAETSVSEEGCRRWGTLLVERGLVDETAEGYRLSPDGATIMTRVNDAVWSLADEHLGCASNAGS